MSRGKKRERSVCFKTMSNDMRYTLFFYKNKLYKNTQAEICPKFKNKLRTITRLKFLPDKFKKFI